MGVDHFQKKMRKRVAWERVGGGEGGGGLGNGNTGEFQIAKKAAK